MRRALWCGLLFGLGFFGALLVWISIVGWVAWAVLVVMEALYIAAFALAWSWISRSPSVAWRVLGAAAAWVVVEVARASVPVVGFAWGELAQSQHDTAWVLDPAAWGGRNLVAFLLMAFNALLAESFAPQGASRRRLAVVALLVVVGVSIVPGPEEADRPVRVALVQGNVPRDVPPSAEKDLQIVTSHARLTQEVAAASPDLVVWPESAVGLDPERVPEVADLLREAAASAGVPMIVGGNTEREDGRYQVMAFHLSPDGRIVERYQKVHLVPFGEYVPNRQALDFIPMLDQVPRDAVPGPGPVLFDAAGGKVAPVISFEGDFGSLVRERAALGAELLVVATNTSTWGESWASAQHVAMSQVRAAENRLWVVHAALSGISAFVAPDGSVVRALPLWEAATATEDIAFVERPSFYARNGDWALWVLVVFSLLAAGSSVLRRGSR